MITKKYYILPVFLVFLLYNCTTSTGPAAPPGSGLTIGNPIPLDGSTVQARLTDLTWTADGDPDSYTVYFSAVSPLAWVSINTTIPIVHKSGLILGESYLWRVEAIYPDGTTISSPAWTFNVGKVFPPGNTLTYHSSLTDDALKTVSVTFQVFDLDDRGVTTMGLSNFELFEDGDTVQNYESVTTLTPLPPVPHNLYTVIMIDNSQSIESGELSELKTAVDDFLNLGLEPSQQVSLYTFSESIIPISGFTNNVPALKSLVAGITAADPTTNLYGAVIDGSSATTDVFDDTRADLGVLLLFTDGKDTQGSHTLNEAMTARFGRQVITVSFNDITEADLEILSKLATAGFFFTTEMTELKNIMTDYHDRLDRYANSFYTIDYQSPVRGDFNHELMIKVAANVYDGPGSFITAYYNSKNF